ncbi:hypothetical protein CDL12_17874 [Handroanthus impetiginosus]|uniref:DC1 domain-containing protein n=1 Tax=Handroanthus impetiginosus TaxID=429701 RepID=A0A2G9GW86_9LAMI|nr:hypothetical protein CDL12_17874 [Handroanthus impetiginosus]
MLEEQRSIKHPSHRHPLTYVRKPSSLFHCDGCGTEERDFAYVCNFCEFWIHKSCALLPTTFQSILSPCQVCNPADELYCRAF